MITETINFLINWILTLVERLSYLGILIGMAIESSFIPFPSEIILIPAGALVAQGKLSFLLALAVAILGSLFGAFINYFLALWLGRPLVEFLISKYGKYFLLSEKSLKKADVYFERHGEITTFVARFIPGIRQIISLPAGFAKMNLSRFAFFTGLGAGLWSAFLLILGYFFGANSQLLKENSIWFYTSIFILSLIILIIYVLLKKKD